MRGLISTIVVLKYLKCQIGISSESLISTIVVLKWCYVGNGTNSLYGLISTIVVLKWSIENEKSLEKSFDINYSSIEILVFLYYNKKMHRLISTIVVLKFEPSHLLSFKNLFDINYSSIEMCNKSTYMEYYQVWYQL